jgi:hypothetical protein
MIPGLPCASGVCRPRPAGGQARSARGYACPQGSTFRKLSGQARSCRRSLIVLACAHWPVPALAVCSESRAEGGRCASACWPTAASHAAARTGPHPGASAHHPPQYDFQLRPLAFEDVDPAVESGELDFVVANPAVYVRWRPAATSCAWPPCATTWPESLHPFRRGVFTRAERLDIPLLPGLAGQDVRGHQRRFPGRLAAARGAFAARAWSPRTSPPDLRRHSRRGDQAVLEGQRGRTVRTDTLERLAAEGRLDPTRLRILLPRSGTPNRRTFPSG